jgi:hypothetical protein
MLEGSEREHSRAAERSVIVECTIAIEPSADFDSPKMPNHALQRTRAIASLLQSWRPAGRVAELGSLGVPRAPYERTIYNLFTNF